MTGINRDTDVQAGFITRMARQVAARFTRSTLVAASLFAASFAAAPVSAQNLFSPVVEVNDQIITRYEVNQRIALMSAKIGRAHV